MQSFTTGIGVLIAEDDGALRAMMLAVLRRCGIETTAARDGQEAIEMLQRTHFNALVLDLMMPRVSGWEVIDWLGAHPEHRPDSVLVVTAADHVAAERLNSQVVNAVFFKPFDIEEFGAYVANCGLRQARDRRKKRVFAS